MSKSYWMVVTTPENFEITRSMGFTLLGLKVYHRKKVQRTEHNDRILYYISRARYFGATATAKSKCFEGQEQIWQKEGGDPLNYRVKIRPDVVLQKEQLLDACQLAPGLEYVRRWPPEDWYLAFLGNLHLLSKRDFSLIENEMHRMIHNKASLPRNAPPRKTNTSTF